MESISLLLKVLWAPGEAMLKVSKTNKVLAPLLLMTLGGLAYAVVTFNYLDMGEATIRMIDQQQQARGTQISPEQRAQMLRTMNSPVVRAVSACAGLVVPTITIVLISLLYFGIFTMVGREGGFKTFLAITAFAFVPSLIRTTAALLTMVVVPSSQIMMDELGNVGPAIMLDRTGMSRKLFAFVAQMDVISIWILILLTIGYKFVSKRSVSTATRAVCVFGVWLVYVAIRVVLA